MIRNEFSEPPSSEFCDEPKHIAIGHIKRVQNPRQVGIPFMQRPTCTINEACRAAGLGRTKLYELIKGGELKTISIGRRRLVQVPSLLKFLKIETDDYSPEDDAR